MNQQLPSGWEVPTQPEKKRTGLWILLTLAILTFAFVVGCSALVVAGVDSASEKVEFTDKAIDVGTAGVAAAGSTIPEVKIYGSADRLEEAILRGAEQMPEQASTTIAGDTTTTVDTETVSQKQAVKKAESYLSHSSFSRQSLIDQLEFEGFSTEDSTYAVDSITVDWNEQAAKKAASYLSHSSFSRQGLIGQLEFEGFTPEQAEYGVSTTGL